MHVLQDSFASRKASLVRFALKQCVDALHRREIAKREGLDIRTVCFRFEKRANRMTVYHRGIVVLSASSNSPANSQA